MSRSLAAALAKLLASEGDTPASLFTEAQRKALDELLRRTGGASTLRQGRGVVYRISQRVSLETVLRDLSPADADTLPHDIPARARNVATRRDSKGGESGHGLHYMVLKAVGEDVSWAADDGRHIELSPLTDIAGAAALAIRPTDSWHSSQPLWLIENQALFDRTDWLPEGTRASLAYYGGQIPAALLAWLAARPRAAAVILFADYDGVGLQNYARLLECCPAPCSFWLMPDWEAKLRDFGNTTIWRDNHDRFTAAEVRLQALRAPIEILELCRVLAREGRALEQETVWLDLAKG
ncbi:MAG: hypothetical protein KDG55_17465 [Rhodocyclaceae bacterium]|nr:hypothetical protein [Rhodocyclaceae bacterium]